MKHDKFVAIMSESGMKPGTLTHEALRLVLVDRVQPATAAARVGVARSTVSKALAKLSAERCPCCGHVRA